MLSLFNSYHLTAVAVVLVVCAVMLWLIFRDAKVFQLNINVDSDSPFARHGAINVLPRDLSLKLVWRGAKGIPPNWDSVLINNFVGRIHPPMTFELLGRKFTVIVDGRDDVVERMVSESIEWLFCNRDGTV